MADKDAIENQEPIEPAAPEQSAATPEEDPTEQSLIDELSAARAEEPETPAESEEPTNPEEPTPPTEPEEPASTEAKPPEDEPAEPETDVSKMTKDERKAYFTELQQQVRAKNETVVGKKLDEHYQPQDQNDLKQNYLDKGFDEGVAELLARDERREQQAQLNEERVEVIRLNSQINGEALQVMHDFPVFDPDSGDYNKEFADKASALYRNAAGAVVDERSGVIVRTNLTPYNFYKELSQLRDSGLSQAQIKGQQAAEKQMASVAPPSSNAPPQGALSAEDKEAKGLEDALNKVR